LLRRRFLRHQRQPTPTTNTLAQHIQRRSQLTAQRRMAGGEVWVVDVAGECLGKLDQRRPLLWT
jgi:hypothetical protein